MNAIKVEDNKVYKVQIEREVWFTPDEDGIVDVLLAETGDDFDTSNIEVHEVRKKGSRWEQNEFDWGDIAMTVLEQLRD